MSWKYRQIYVEDQDALDPYHFQKNMSEYAEEMNGYLDQDNMRTGIVGSAQLKAHACNEFFTDYHRDSAVPFTAATGSWVPDINTTAWQRLAPSDASDLAAVQFATDFESQLRVCFGASWYWSNNATTLIADFIDEMIIEFRVLVDGVTVSDSGEYSATLKFGSCWLVGTTPCVSGPHDVWTEMRMYQKSGGVDMPFQDILPNYSDANTDPSVWADTVAIGARQLIAHARYR